MLHQVLLVRYIYYTDQTMVKNLVQLFSKAAKVVCFSLLTIVLLNGTVMLDAIAMPTDSADIAMPRAANEVDRVVGEGTSAQIEGKVQSDIGTVKRSVGEVSGQVEGVADQIEGKVKGDIGRTQDAAEDIKDDAEDAAEGFVDSVKELFN